MVNPNIGRSVNMAFLEREFLKADRSGPAALAAVRQPAPRCRNRPGAAHRSLDGRRILGQRADPTLTYEEVLDRSEVVVVGIDGGGLDDLFGLAVLGRDLDTQRWLLWSHAWCHVGVLERRK